MTGRHNRFAELSASRQALLKRMEDEEYPEYLKKQSYEDLLSISYSIDQMKQGKRYAMVIAEIARRDENGEGKVSPNDRRESPLILFPEIVGVTIVAVATPACLLKILLSGHVVVGVVGLLSLCAALYFAVRFILRRQYGFAILPMLVVLGLFMLVQKLNQ